MTGWDEEDENLAQFLESEVLSRDSDQDEQDIEEKEIQAKRICRDDSFHDRNEIVDRTKVASSSKVVKDCSNSNVIKMELKRIDSGILSKVPPELFHHILKFLSSEDLISCSQVCKFMNHVAADDTLWRRLYCLRWGLLSPTKRLRECAWKTLYIRRDEEDLFQSSRNCQPEFKEYYIQMHTAKRSEAPLLSQFVTRRVEKYFWSLKTSSWFAECLVAALTHYFHQARWSLMLSRVGQWMKLSHSWEQDVSHGRIYWATIALTSRSSKMH